MRKEQLASEVASVSSELDLVAWALHVGTPSAADHSPRAEDWIPSVLLHPLHKSATI